MACGNWTPSNRDDLFIGLVYKQSPEATISDQSAGSKEHCNFAMALYLNT